MSSTALVRRPALTMGVTVSSSSYSGFYVVRTATTTCHSSRVQILICPLQMPPPPTLSPLRTKLHRPPVASDAVPRPRLVEQLEFEPVRTRNGMYRLASMRYQLGQDDPQQWCARKGRALPTVRDVIKLLERDGWILARTKGSTGNTSTRANEAWSQSQEAPETMLHREPSTAF